MSTLHPQKRAASGDTSLLLLFGLAVTLLHILVNGQYGFHRDELLTFDNARHLAWGYASYPPVTALLGRVELALFGTSLIGFRFFPALAQGIILVLTGLTAREFGGGREAQLVAATAVTIGGPSIWAGTSLSYTTFDYLWWVLAAYFVARLLRTNNPRWWLAIGATIGLGLLTKYTMAFLVLGILAGMALTPARRFVLSLWFWSGLALALLLFLPNALWLAQHEFVTLTCMRTIHNRDIGWGWTDNFLAGQLWKCTNVVTVPVWIAGLWSLFATRRAERYQMLGWMYVFPLLALFALHGRDYYLAPAYPMLLAAGAVWGEQWLTTLAENSARVVRRATWQSLAISGLASAALILPIAPVGTAWWHIADAANGNFNMEIGWPELASTVARIRAGLPASDQARLGILAGDEGETGAINLYGPALGLPAAISGMNSNWMRGYPDPPPQTLITLGLKRDVLDRIFASCELAGHIAIPYGIENIAVKGYDDIFVCRQMRTSWPEFWKNFRYYG